MKKVDCKDWADFSSDYRGYHREGKRGNCEIMEHVQPDGAVIDVVVYHPAGLREYEIYPELALEQYKVDHARNIR